LCAARRRAPLAKTALPGTPKALHGPSWLIFSPTLADTNGKK